MVSTVLTSINGATHSIDDIFVVSAVSPSRLIISIPKKTYYSIKGIVHCILVLILDMGVSILATQYRVVSGPVSAVLLMYGRLAHGWWCA